MHSHQVKPDALISACVVTHVPIFYASRKASIKSAVKQKDINSLEKFQRKCLKHIQGIPDNTSNSACLALLGMLPIKDILNKNLLNLFINMNRDESSIEYEIARRQVVMKDWASESTFTYIQSILNHYDLPSVLQLLSNPPSKEA